MKDVFKVFGNLNRARNVKVPLLIIVLVAIIGFSIAACDNGSGTVLIPPLFKFNSVKFNSVTADGSVSQTTTQLTLTFSQAINGLTADDIIFSGISGVTKGTLSGSGPTYTLPITVIEGGTLTVEVSKTGYAIIDSSKTVTIYYPDEDTTLPNEDTVVTLTLDTWFDGNITSTTNTVWYSFSVTSGTTYHIWWNDSYEGNSTKSLDVRVSATYSNGTSIFTDTDSAWTTAQSFTANQTGTVKIKVVPYSSGDTGTFAIAYSTSATRPNIGSENIVVTFNNITANGSTTQTTTQLTLTFSQVINGLTADDIIFSGISGVTKGTLSGSGPTYILPIDGFTAGGTLSVAVTKSGYTISDSPKTVTIYYYSNNSVSVGIVINLTGMNEWELTEQTTQATPNVNKTFTVTGTYAAYRWYLDGISVGTTSSYIFNKPVGVYQLVVVVTDSTGEKRSGRCWITVGGQQPLTINVWADSRFTDANGEDWYSFPVTNGTTYRIWWNDYNQSNGTKTGTIAVSAKYENATTFIFGGTNTSNTSGWSTAQSFTANQTGKVYIRVIPYNRSSSYTGTYGIVYSASSTKPDILLTGAVSITGTAQVGQILTANTSNLGGNGTITYQWKRGTTNIGTNNSAYTVQAADVGYAITVTVSRTGFSGNVTSMPTSTITASTPGTPNGSETNPYPLTLSTWLNGTITSTTNTVWYSFSVTSGTTYRVWWNDSYEGNSTKSLDVKVSAVYSNGTSIFTNVDSGWTTAQSFTANQTGTVKIKVVPYSSGDTGTFAVVYSTSSTRP
jgi:hypothetical protein